MLLAELVTAHDQVRATRSRRDKVAVLAALLRRLPAHERALGARYLAGAPRQQRLGVRRAGVRRALVAPAAQPSLTLTEVDAALEAIAAEQGPGSQSARHARLADLLGRATAAEQELLVALLLGELRQGAQTGLVTQALAEAAEADEAQVRRALMLQGDLGTVAEVALGGGRAALAAVGLAVGRPVQPMLATSAGSVGEALADLGTALVEHKLDGARIQAHRDGGSVRVFTRSLREVTDAVPGVVRAVAALPASALVLDGEAVGLAPDGSPEPFQRTMRRFGAAPEPDAEVDAADVAATAGADVPLVPRFFDVLHRDGEDLLDAPLAQRRAALGELVPEDERIPGAVCDDVAQAEAIAAQAQAAGHEGVMVKDLAAPYRAGRRGQQWRKVKPVHTLDLLVVAVEWGSGRRRGWLSNLHLAARDPTSGEPVMLGKTFKGLTDALLAWQTERFLALEVAREGHVVRVRPEQVVEVAVDGVQDSPRYPAGLALRFARVVRYRPDKPPEQADTLEAVRALHPDARGRG